MSLEISMKTKTDKPIVVEKRKFSPFRFLQEIKDELRRVTWTPAAELKTFTKIVIGSTFVFGLGTYCGDLIIKSILDGIALLFRWVTG